MISLCLQEMSWREVTCARTGMEDVGVGECLGKPVDVIMLS